MHFLNDKEVVINQLWPQKRSKEKEKRSNDRSFWHIRYCGIARQNQPRAAYTPLCIIYLWQLKNHHQMLSSDVPVMLAVTGNTVQEFGKDWNQLEAQGKQSLFFWKSKDELVHGKLKLFAIQIYELIKKNMDSKTFITFRSIKHMLL